MPLKEVWNAIRPFLQGSHGRVGVIQGGLVAAAVGIGLAKLASIAAHHTRFFWRKFLRPGKRLSKYGSWAIVTGATDGIGRAYCDELAKQGLNIFLVSRNNAKLQKTAKEIEASHQVQTKTHAIDLAEAGCLPVEDAAWAALQAALHGVDVGILVNNAGTEGECPEYFHMLGRPTIHDLPALNTAAVIKMTYVVLAGMLERGRGAVVNVASLAGSIPPPPLGTLYAASKRFLHAMTISLSKEYRHQGIHFQVHSPGYTHTRMANYRPVSFRCPTPATYAAAACRAIGYEVDCVPYVGHALEIGMTNALPHLLLDAYVWKLTHQHRDEQAALRANLKKPL